MVYSLDLQKRGGELPIESGNFVPLGSFRLFLFLRGLLPAESNSFCTSTLFRFAKQRFTELAI